MNPGANTFPNLALEEGIKLSLPFGLTSREREIVSAVVVGYSNKEIAQEFSVTEDTVKHHLTDIFNKLGVSNRLELAVASIHHGLGEEM